MHNPGSTTSCTEPNVKSARHPTEQTSALIRTIFSRLASKMRARRSNLPHAERGGWKSCPPRDARDGPCARGGRRRWTDKSRVRQVICASARVRALRWHRPRRPQQRGRSERYRRRRRSRGPRMPWLRDECKVREGLVVRGRREKKGGGERRGAEKVGAAVAPRAMRQGSFVIRSRGAARGDDSDMCAGPSPLQGRGAGLLGGRGRTRGAPLRPQPRRGAAARGCAQREVRHTRALRQNMSSI